MPLTATPEDVGLCSKRLENVRRWAAGYVDSGKLPSAVTLVARHGEIVFLDIRGVRDVEAKTPVTEDTISRFYSMSKPVTSVAAMMLYEEGGFQLEDPVSRYIPAFAETEVFVGVEGATMKTEPPRRAMTVHDLFRHTSGLIYGLFSRGPVANLYAEHKTDFFPDDGPLSEVVGRLARIPLTFHPGERWCYGVSTDVLGYLVEVISGRTLEQFFAERIFEPLGMHDTGFALPPDKVDRFAALYGPDDAGGLKLLAPPYAHAPTTFSGGGGLVSTLGDYFRFCEMLRRKGAFDGVRLLGRKTVEFMTANHLPGDLAAMGEAVFNETTYAGVGFGLGFAVMLDPAKNEIIGSPGEYSWGGAASTTFWIDPAEDMTVIFLTQMLPSSTYPLRRELRALAYQALID